METATRAHPHTAAFPSPTHSGLLRSLAKLVRLHRRTGSRGGGANEPNSHHHDRDLDDGCSRTTARSFFSFKPSRLKQSGPLDGTAGSAYTRSEALHEDDVKRQNRGREATDTVLAMVFAAVSAIKAAYAQLQLAQAPYDPEAVQAADVAVVAELKRISHIKHWYFSTKQCYPPGAMTNGGEEGGGVGGGNNNNMYYHQVQMQMLSPDAHVAAEILEMRSLIKTYQVTTKKLENELKSKDEEVARLGEELKEAEAQKRDLEERLRALLDSARKNGQVGRGGGRNNASSTNGDVHGDYHHNHNQQLRRHHHHHHRSLSSSFSAFPTTMAADDHDATAAVAVDLGRLTPTLFIDTLRRTVKSARSFTKELVREMHTAGWDAYSAAAAIAPGVVAALDGGGRDEDHLHLVLQSYICRRMFSAFQYPQFRPGREKSKTCDIRRRRERFLEEYVEMEQQRHGRISGSSSSVAFEEFLRDKYRAVVHPRMEAAFFGGAGNADQTLLLPFPKQHDLHQQQPFFRCFHDLARRVWMLQRLFHAFEPEAGAAVFEVPKGSRFSEVYMQSTSPAVLSPGDDDAVVMVVGFTVVPGFKLRGTVVPCRVYLVAEEDGTGW